MTRALPIFTFALIAATAACRDNQTPAPTADRASAPVPKAIDAAPPAPAKIESAKVSTQRTDIPRTGYDPVTIELPVIGGLGDAALEKKVNALFTPDAIIGESLADVRADAAKSAPGEVPLGTQSSEFTVDYNKNGVLEINALTAGNGAYPSVSRFHAVVDLRSGAKITAKEAFAASKLPALIALLDGRLQANVKKSEAMKEGVETESLTSASFGGDGPNDFSVSDKNLTFHYDFGFPHAELALQPDGDVALSWSEAAPYLDPHGPLAPLAPSP